MNIYQQELLKIRTALFHRQDLCDRVIEAKKYIDSCYYTNITLDELASKACLSKFHFIRLFKKLYGITPNQYLTSVRLEKAKALLKSGATVTTACFSVGFDSTTSFAGLFKKITGTTPSKHIKKTPSPAAIPIFIYFSPPPVKKQF